MKYIFIPKSSPKACLYEGARDYVEEYDDFLESDESAWKRELQKKQDDEFIDNICGFCGHHNPTDGDCPTCSRIYEARY